MKNITSTEEQKKWKDNSVCKECKKEKKIVIPEDGFIYPFCWNCKYLNINNGKGSNSYIAKLRIIGCDKRCKE